MKMSPICVGLVGLSATTPPAKGYANGTWGHTHLASLLNSPHYKIVALCNSTVNNARKSIEHNKLDPATRAYGSTEELAKDPGVDLIVVSVHVDKHYDLVKPVLQHKKNIFVEFPLAKTYPQVEELANLARQAGVKTIVGAQARANPSLAKVKELVNSKAIGDVVSSTWVGHVGFSAWYGLPEAMKHLSNWDSAVGRINIGLGHGLEPFLNVLGEFKDVQAVFKIHGKSHPLFGTDGTVVDPAYKVTEPEYILIQGVLESGAVASINLRFTPASVDAEGFRWVISGSEGELEFTGTSGFIQGSLPTTKVLLKKWKGETEEVNFTHDEPDHITALPGAVINTARLYESFATGDEHGYPSFESARKVHYLIERVKKVAIWAP